MERVVLGLDIGGANLKAATSAGRALSVPFAVWKQPDALSAELRKLIAKFPEASEVAATMTAELCDCYETKREGVRRIVDDLANATKLPIRIWSTEGKFLTPKAAKANHMKVAAANWHALATFASQYCRHGDGLLIDIGSTTTDFVRLQDGAIQNSASTDPTRLKSGELLYTGVKRTPVCAVVRNNVAAEFFATMEDVYIVLGLIPECSESCDTADGRPAVLSFAHDRLCRMLGGDRETIDTNTLNEFARWAFAIQRQMISEQFRKFDTSHYLHNSMTVLISGAGEFLARAAIDQVQPDAVNIISLTEKLGTKISRSAPAYAVAMLALTTSD